MKKRLNIVIIIIGIFLFITLFVTGSLSDDLKIALISLIGALLIISIFVLCRSFFYRKYKKWYFSIIVIFGFILYSYFSINSLFIKFESNQLSSEQSIVVEKYRIENNESMKDQYFNEVIEFESKIDDLKNKHNLYGIFQTFSIFIIFILPYPKVKKVG